MSFITVQRLIVRMLYDPAFTAAVFESPEVTLDTLGLSPEEVHWITRTDRRAWQLDPMRRSRTLHALIEEYPASAASALNVDGDAHRLDAFFSSTEFHDAIQQRGALAAAFGAFLTAHTPFAPMARIEAAIARCRRAPSHTPPPPGEVTMRPGCEVLALPGGALAHFSEITSRLASMGCPAPEAMLADGFSLDGLSGLDEETVEHVLLEQGPRLGEIPSALADLLLAASQPIARAALHQAAMALGAEEGEATELIDELIADGVLFQAS